MQNANNLNVNFAHECRIRDAYAKAFPVLRRDEKVLQCEAGYETSPVRADLRSIDSRNVIRVWEFKIEADYSSLGQVLTYLALAKVEEGPDRALERPIVGVIAAFTIPREIRLAVSMNNLGIEIVEIPPYLREAGSVPTTSAPAPMIPVIPRTTH